MNLIYSWDPLPIYCDRFMQEVKPNYFNPKQILCKDGSQLESPINVEARLCMNIITPLHLSRRLVVVELGGFSQNMLLSCDQFSVGRYVQMCRLLTLPTAPARLCTSGKTRVPQIRLMSNDRVSEGLLSQPGNITAILLNVC